MAVGGRRGARGDDTGEVERVMAMQCMQRNCISSTSETMHVHARSEENACSHVRSEENAYSHGHSESELLPSLVKRRRGRVRLDGVHRPVYGHCGEGEPGHVVATHGCTRGAWVTSSHLECCLLLLVRIHDKHHNNKDDTHDRQHRDGHTSIIRRVELLPRRPTAMRCCCCGRGGRSHGHSLCCCARDARQRRAQHEKPSLPVAPFSCLAVAQR